MSDNAKKEILDALNAFMSNHIAHLDLKLDAVNEKVEAVEDSISVMHARVDKLESVVNFIRGQIWFLAPLALSILGMTVYAVFYK